MKVIDLLNKIADGEEVPKKLLYDHEGFVFDNDCRDYMGNLSRNWLFDDYSISMIINDEVEVIEEKPRDIEVCGTFFTKSEYNKLFKEDKKIEKLDHKDFTNRFGAEEITDVKLVNKINEIIDKVNKGE